MRKLATMAVDLQRCDKCWCMGIYVLPDPDDQRDLIFLPCDYCPKEKKEKKEEKNKLPQSKSITRMNGFCYNMAGPYADGSYVINHNCLISPDRMKLYGNTSWISESEMYEMSNKCMIIALYESNPVFWGTHHIKGPWMLLEKLSLYAYFSNDQMLERYHLQPLADKFQFNATVHLLEYGIETNEYPVTCENKSAPLLHLYFDMISEHYLNCGQKPRA